MESLEKEGAARAVGGAGRGGQGEGEGAGEGGGGRGGGEGLGGGWKTPGCAMEVDGLAEISERILHARLDVDSVAATALSQFSQLSQLSSWEGSAGGPAPEGPSQLAAPTGTFSTQGFMAGATLCLITSSHPLHCRLQHLQYHLQQQQQCRGEPLEPTRRHPQAHRWRRGRRRFGPQEAPPPAAGQCSRSSGSSGGRRGSPGPSLPKERLPPHHSGVRQPAGRGSLRRLCNGPLSPGVGLGHSWSCPPRGLSPRRPPRGPPAPPGGSRAVVSRQRLEPSQPLEAQLSPSLAALLSVLSTESDSERLRPGRAGAAAASSGGSARVGAGSGRVGLGEGGRGPGHAGWGVPRDANGAYPNPSALLSILSS